MKKIIAMFSAVLVAVSAFAAIPANAETVNENVLKYTPKVDGKLDVAYLQSFYINHDWPEERSSRYYWGCGRYAFTDLEVDENGNTVDGSIGYNTTYGWDLQASTYFLWDDDNIYVAINVTDNDYGCIDDAHYQMAVESSPVHPWLHDAINLKLTYKGLTFDICAERAGRYICAAGEQNWSDMRGWTDHTVNNDLGYYATSETGNGYIIEIKIPINESVKEKILKDGGNFKFGISVIDAPSDAVYALDPARLADGIEVEGSNFEDFMLHNGCLNPVDNKPDQKIKLADQAPVIDESEENAVVDDVSGGNAGGSTGSGGASAPTGDVGIAVAAVALAAGACFVAIKRRK